MTKTRKIRWDFLDAKPVAGCSDSVMAEHCWIPDGCWGYWVLAELDCYVEHPDSVQEGEEQLFTCAPIATYEWRPNYYFAVCLLIAVGLFIASWMEL